MGKKSEKKTTHVEINEPNHKEQQETHKSNSEFWTPGCHPKPALVQGNQS